MSFTSINSALIQAWVNNSEFALSTAYENRDFKPDNASPWAALHHMPIDNGVASLGLGGTDKHTGILQIDLNYPLDTGTGAASAKADEIAAFFKAGTKVSYNGVHLTIERTKREQGRPVNGMYRLPLSIYYYTRTPR